MSSAEVLKAARAKGWRIGTAESCTGGMVAAALTDIAGASAVFERGFITYSNLSKTEMLGVNPTTLERYGAVSEEVALEMAQGVLKHSQADLAVSITGIAGPGGSGQKPEGLVCFGTATSREQKAETLAFGALGRAKVREAAATKALDLLLNMIRASS